MKWTADDCPDWRGFTTIRPSDGTEHGDTQANPIATVYAAEHVAIVKEAPAMLALLRSFSAEAYSGLGMQDFDMERVGCDGCGFEGGANDFRNPKHHEPGCFVADALALVARVDGQDAESVKLAQEGES